MERNENQLGESSLNSLRTRFQRLQKTLERYAQEKRALATTEGSSITKELFFTKVRFIYYLFETQ